MNDTQKEKSISKAKARIDEINELIKDITLPNWCELVTERNSLSVNVKQLKQRVKRQPYMDSVSIKQWVR